MARMVRRRFVVGGLSMLLLAGSSCRVPSYYAAGWSDANYYQGGAGIGPTPRTVRIVGFLRAVPSSSTRILWSYENGSVHGARIYTGHGGLPSIRAIFGGSGGYQITPGYQFSAPNVGKLFVIHAWADTVAHLAMAGSEIGTGSAPVTVTSPGAGARITLGRYQHSTGYGADPDVGVVCVSMSGTAITLAQVAADAATIMGSQATNIPLLPGEAVRHVAFDGYRDGTPWPDRLGLCPMTRTGAPTFTRVPA